MLALVSLDGKWTCKDPLQPITVIFLLKPLTNYRSKLSLLLMLAALANL